MAQLFANLASDIGDMGPIGLVEGLPDRGGNDGVLAAGDIRQRMSRPLDAAALPVQPSPIARIG